MAVLKYKSSDGTWKSIVTKGGGSIAEETDPIFSASPAASITEAKKVEWDNKQDAITDLDAIRSGAAKGTTALQSYTEKYTGTITGITMNGVSKGTSGVVDLGDTGAYPIVEEANTSVTLTGNRMTRITTQVVDSLEIILPEDNGEATNECIVTFQVDSSSTGAELIVPSNVQWAGGTIPAMSAGKTYEISFLNGCATFLEF